MAAEPSKDGMVGALRDVVEAFAGDEAALAVGTTSGFCFLPGLSSTLSSPRLSAGLRLAAAFGGAMTKQESRRQNVSGAKTWPTQVYFQCSAHARLPPPALRKAEGVFAMKNH